MLKGAGWIEAASEAAVGNIAGQIVGNALGVEHGFGWKSVALSAFSACVGQGLNGVVALGNAGMNLVAKQALVNAMTQGVAVVIGVQKGFSWTNVAASAIGVGVGAGVNAAIGDSFGGTDFGLFAKGAVSGFTAGAATALARGGHVSIQQVSVDAFGQTLGNTFAENASNPGTQEYKLASVFQDNAIANSELRYNPNAPQYNWATTPEIDPALASTFGDYAGARYPGVNVAAGPSVGGIIYPRKSISLI